MWFIYKPRRSLLLIFVVGLILCFISFKLMPIPDSGALAVKDKISLVFRFIGLGLMVISALAAPVMRILGYHRKD